MGRSKKLRALRCRPFSKTSFPNICIGPYVILLLDVLQTKNVRSFGESRRNRIRAYARIFCLKFHAYYLACHLAFYELLHACIGLELHRMFYNKNWKMFL